MKINSYINRVNIYACIGIGLLAFFLCACRQKSLADTLVNTSVMEPTIPKGSTVTVDWSAYATNTPDRFDMVVVNYPGEKSFRTVFRVIGLPQENVEIVNGKVKINKQELNEIWISPSQHSWDKDENTTSVQTPNAGFFGKNLQEEEYFLMGDNRLRSRDSRYIGAIPRNQILGKVISINRHKFDIVQSSTNITEASNHVVGYAKPLKAGHRLQAEDIIIIEVPAKDAKALNAIPAGSIDSLVGRRLIFAGQKNHPISWHAIETP